MKLKRAISVLSVLALTVGLFSSCGQEQDTSSQIKDSEPDLAYKLSDKS